MPLAICENKSPVGFKILNHESLVNHKEYLNRTYQSLDAIAIKCIDYVIPKFVSSHNHTPTETHCLIALAADDSSVLLESFNIEFHTQYESTTVKDVAEAIAFEIECLERFANECFSTAKDAIISQAIDGTLSGDMNDLSFDQLFTYGTNIEKRYISDNGDVVVSYESSLAEWVSESGNFTFPIGEEGAPVNNAPDEPFELDNGDFIEIKGFSEFG